jgi:hypothetical protein
MDWSHLARNSRFKEIMLGTGGQGRKHKPLLDMRKEAGSYWELK